MRSESYQQYAIVAADSAQSLTDQLNAKLYELRKKHPVVTFEGLTARICYSESFDVCESWHDEWSERGVNLTCQDCPLFEPLRTMKGSEDRRAKWGDCIHGYHGRTTRTSRACDKLFQMIDSGEVRLCLAE